MGRPSMVTPCRTFFSSLFLVSTSVFRTEFLLHTVVNHELIDLCQICRTQSAARAEVAYTTDNGVTKTLAVSRGPLGATWCNNSRGGKARDTPDVGKLMRMLLPKGSLRSCRTAGRRELATRRLFRVHGQGRRYPRRVRTWRETMTTLVQFRLATVSLERYFNDTFLGLSITHISFIRWQRQIQY
jgi:hypothetical protein